MEILFPTVRGFILNTDVTFKNITLRFSNRLHDAIFANGHKLVLEDVTCDSGFRYVDIFGGSLYENGKNMGIIRDQGHRF